MSGIWASNKTNLIIDDSIRLFLRRGHSTTQKTINNTHITVCHSHDQSGIFVSPTTTVVLDGFIYNHNPQKIATNVNSIDQLIETVSQLNGEFAMFVETENFYAAVTDYWKTKNLWIIVEDNFVSICSTQDAIRLHHTHAYPVPPNTITVIDKKDLSIKKYNTNNWNLKQFDTSHSKLFDALEKAVSLRFDNNSVATLSSGYDSGVIACALHKQGHRKFSLSLLNNESSDVIKKRLSLHNGKILLDNNQMSRKEIEDLVSLNWQHGTFGEEGESISRICKHMNKVQKFNIVSGNGGDEIYSDYGNVGKQLDPKSLFGGFFPKDLNLVWPCHDFLGRISLPVSRLDSIAGYYAIQHKDPLLDRNVVQSWLNTTSELKNARYKNWMFEYLTDHNYPVEENFKNGLKFNK